MGRIRKDLQKNGGGTGKGSWRLKNGLVTGRIGKRHKFAGESRRGGFLGEGKKRVGRGKGKRIMGKDEKKAREHFIANTTRNADALESYLPE